MSKAHSLIMSLAHSFIMSKATLRVLFNSLKKEGNLSNKAHSHSLLCSRYMKHYDNSKQGAYNT